jgi:sugar phosphate isomerase/epimerase
MTTSPVPPLKLHNAMWPGLVGKGQDGQEPFISFVDMLDLTARASLPSGQRFEGVDVFLAPPHFDIADDSSEAIDFLVQHTSDRNLKIGSLVPAIWPAAGGGSAMGSDDDQQRFLAAVRKACHIGRYLEEQRVRDSGIIRIDTGEFGIKEWSRSRTANTARIVSTIQRAGQIARDNGQRLAIEMEVCWAGIHTPSRMLEVLESVNMPDIVGLQADLAHILTSMLGVVPREVALLHDGYTRDEFYVAWEEVADMLRPWTIDFHVAQNDGTVRGAGSHAPTGKHCMPDDPNGKLDIAKCAAYWLKGADERGIRHICWDGCMFPNDILGQAETWDTVLATMVEVRDVYGQN